jgi:hypothetical protein
MSSKNSIAESGHSARPVPTPRRSGRNVVPSKADEDAVNYERHTLLSHRRAGYASQVTIQYRKLCAAIEDSACPIEVIKDYFGALKAAYAEFSNVHNEFAILSAKVDPSVLDRISDHYLCMTELVSQAGTRLDRIIAESAITPHDSVSQATTSSKSSRASSSLAKVTAKKAALVARAKVMGDLQQKKIKVVQAECELEQVELQADIQAAAAEEEALAQHYVDTGTAVKQPRSVEMTPFLPVHECSTPRSEGPSQRVLHFGPLMANDVDIEEWQRTAQQSRMKTQLELQRLENELDVTIQAVIAEKENPSRCIDMGEACTTARQPVTAKMPPSLPEVAEEVDSGGPFQESMDQFEVVINDQLRLKEAKVEFDRQELENEKRCWEAQMKAIREHFEADLKRERQRLAANVKEEGLVECVDENNASTQLPAEKLPDVHQRREGPSQKSLNPIAPEWPPVPGHQASYLRYSTPNCHGEPPTRSPCDVDVGKSHKLAGHETTNSQVWANPDLLISDYQTGLHQKMIDAIRLPKTSIMKFDGEPTQYWIFMSTFDSSVHNASVTDADKLSCLFEYCVGKAAKVISPCALMNPSEGYMKARTLPKNRFGDDYVIAKAWINKIVDGPPVKPNSGEAIQEFTDDVRGCMETLKSMKRLQEVESQDRMVSIMLRLPMYLQSRWRKEAYRTRQRKDRYPSFLEFVEWLEMVAGEANDPVFGACSRADKTPTPKLRDSKGGQKKPVSSFNVQASGKPDVKVETKFKSDFSKSQKLTKCRVCEGGHNTSGCESFKKFDVKKRLEVIKDSKLCFNCLDFANHSYRQCRRPSQCKHDGCTFKHSELLHDALVNSKDKVVESVKIDAKSCVCGPSKVDGSKIALPIVRVHVRGKGQRDFITTYALLDTGSNKTFCSKDLLNQCKLTGVKTTLSLQTLVSGQDAVASEVALEVTATTGKLKKRQIVPLPKVYAVDGFPKLDSSLVSQADVDRWCHLKGIAVSDPLGKDVMLLIGQDTPSALIPLEVRHGNHNEPYATRTTLGWILSGPLGGGVCSDYRV